MKRWEQRNGSNIYYKSGCFHQEKERWGKNKKKEKSYGIAQKDGKRAKGVIGAIVSPGRGMEIGTGGASGCRMVWWGSG